MSFEPLLTLTQSGPKISESSAKVYRDGLTMRLSGDLIHKATGGTKIQVIKFYPWIDRKAMVLHLKLTNEGQETITVMRGWYASKGKSKSMLVSIRPVLEVLAWSVADSPGEYVANAQKDLIEVYFNRRITNGSSKRQTDIRRSISSS